jgi:hypothetical protein
VDEDPSTIQWASEEDQQQAQEYWDELHPAPWDGVSKPKESQFDDYEGYEDAKIKFRVDRELSGRTPAGPPPISDPRDNDDYFPEKQEIINQIEKYQTDEQRALAVGDHEKARHCQQMKKSYERDFHKLETEHPTPNFKKAMDEGLKQYQADLDNAVDNPDDYEKRRNESKSPEQFYRDNMQRIKVVNSTSDDGTLYFLMGDSKYGRLEDYHVAKIELSPEVKQKIIQESAYSGTLYDRLLAGNFIQPMEPIKNSKDPQHMTQEQYERWREKQGAKPKYHRIL